METGYELSTLLDQLEGLIEASLRKIEEQASVDTLKQFKIIDDAVAQLQAAKTPVPEAMLKIHEELQSKAGDAAATAESLSVAHRRLEGLLDRTRPVASKGSRKVAQPTPRAGGLQIPQLKEAIVEALTALGGTATRSDVFSHIEERLQYDFTPEDLQIVPGGLSRWKTRCSQARRDMIRSGVLEDCQGLWALR